MVIESNSYNIVSNLISKKDLCMYTLAAALIFFNMSNDKKSKIPKNYAVIVSIALIFYALIYSIFSFYNFYIRINKLQEYCKKNKCVETQDDIVNTKYFYIFTTSLFILILFIISYLLIKY